MPNGLIKVEDLERMRIPKRYWMSSIDQIEEDVRRDIALKFVENVKDKNGNGLLLYGPHGHGKHYFAISVMKRLKATCKDFTGLFVDAEEIQDNFLLDDFDDGVSFELRMKTVDLLVIGKFGMESSHAYFKLEEIIRNRIDYMKSTIMVSSLTIDKLKEMRPNLLDSKDKDSVASIGGVIVSFNIKGKDYNKIIAKEIALKLSGEPNGRQPGKAISVENSGDKR